MGFLFDQKDKKPFYCFLAFLFIVPRLIRILYPDAWLEDPFYLYASFLIKKGMIPFRDFGHTQLPGTEYLLAFFYSLFGTSYRVAETVSQAVIYANTWLIFLIGMKLCNKAVGILAALIFSCSSLVFRYHIWEREVFVLFMLTLAFYLLLSWRQLNFRRSMVLSLILTTGIFFKLTTVVPLVGAILFILVIRKEMFNALVVSAITFVLTCLVCLFLFVRSPEDVFNQAFLYHFVKGATFISWKEKLLFPLNVLDIALALGVPGILFWKKEIFPDFWFPIFLTLSEWAFFTFLSPNIWPHNYIPSLLLLSLSGAIFIFYASEMFWKRRKIIMPCLSLIVLFLMLKYVSPIKNLNWALGSTYGFGYVPREEIVLLSKYIESRTSKEDLLLLPQYIASESDRRSVISDRIEATGVFRWIERKRQQGHKIRNIIETCKGKSFSQMQRDTMVAGWNDVNLLIKGKKIKLIVLDVVPGERIPFSPRYLRDKGYSPKKICGPYIVWTPNDRPVIQ